MNAHAHALAVTAYGAPSAACKSPRSVEYELLSRITSRLRAARDAKPFVFAALTDAIDENRKLWVALAVDLAAPENSLPQGLRLQRPGLTQFSLRHTDAVLNGDESPDALIDINLAILRGLSGMGDVP